MSGDLNAIPFGTQYYRAPVPLKQDWEKDFAVIRDTGLDCLKLWVQWRWNHPAFDETDFSDILGLCDTAHKYGLKIVLNTILDIAPSWLYDHFPDAHMIMGNGRVAYSQSTACRQIGGSPGPCYHHHGAWEKAWEFMAAAGKTFANHPAVWGWDLWNEPELSMVHRYICEKDTANMVCYCSHTRKAFADWLLAKYGSLDAVNLAHSRNYRRPEQIEMPRNQEIYRDMIDFRLFFCHTLADNMKRRAEIIRAAAPGQRVVTHTVPPTALTITNAANDEWLLAEPVEEFGASYPRFAPVTYEMDMNRSAAKGKRLWSAEFYTDSGSNPEVTPAYEAMVKQTLMLPLFLGYKAYLLWQWRDEKIGREGGWGVHRGIPQPTWPAVKLLKHIVVDVMRKHGAWLKDAQPVQPLTAIMFNPESEVMAYCTEWNSKPYHDTMIGCHQALDGSNLPVHFVHAREVIAGGLANYKVLVMPYPVWISRELAGAIREWVANGGTLISEAHFAGRDPSNGFCVEVIPGLGFDEVFGARQAYYRRIGGTQLGDAPVDVTMTTTMDLPFLPGGSTLVGHRGMETLEPTTAQVLAVHVDGKPAATINQFGKGRAILLGSFLGGAYDRAKGVRNLERLFRSLLPADVERCRPDVLEGDARVKTLHGAGQEWVYVENLTDARQTIRFSLPGQAPLGQFPSVLDDTTLTLTAAGDRRVASITLPGKAVAAFASPAK